MRSSEIGISLPAPRSLFYVLVASHAACPILLCPRLVLVLRSLAVPLAQQAREGSASPSIQQQNKTGVLFVFTCSNVFVNPETIRTLQCKLCTVRVTFAPLLLPPSWVDVSCSMHPPKPSPSSPGPHTVHFPLLRLHLHTTSVAHLFARAQAFDGVTFPTPPFSIPSRNLPHSATSLQGYAQPTQRVHCQTFPSNTRNDCTPTPGVATLASLSRLSFLPHQSACRRSEYFLFDIHTHPNGNSS